MLFAIATHLRATRFGLGAGTLVALYAALLAGFVSATSRPPPSTIIYVTARR